jgi:hypothetical protein
MNGKNLFTAEDAERTQRGLLTSHFTKGGARGIFYKFFHLQI